MSDANDYLMASGMRWASFKLVGDTVEGRIVRAPVLQQRTDFATKQPLTWDDGSPRMEVVAPLATDKRDDDEDDGLRALHIHSDMRRAIQEAVRAVGATGLDINGRLLVRHTGVAAPKQRGGFGQKLFEAAYQPPEAAPAPLPTDVDPDDIPF